MATITTDDLSRTHRLDGNNNNRRLEQNAQT
jgi:hypothetical protein